MRPIVLRENPRPDDDSWNFIAVMPTTIRPGYGKHILFSPQAIKLDITQFPANRILRADDISKFVLVSFESLRFPDTPFSATRDYLIRLFKAGLFLNGVQYRFYGHSNSQLRSRSCFLREANTDQELNDRLYAFGDFKKIMNVAKRAKRIGLLFSKAELDWNLDPRWTQDIDDIVINGETFSDGCGLMSKRFAVQLSRHKRYIYHGRPYTPCIFQIRYRRERWSSVLTLSMSTKGVLMLHPELAENYHVQFRASQRKFIATQDNTFSVVDHSTPYAFGRLNNDVIVLMASLGITSETFLAKQEAYHHWIRAASNDWEVAFNFLCALGHYGTAERLLLDGIESAEVKAKIRSSQMSELAAFKKNEKYRSRMVVLKSRLLFGVCDPYGVLDEGEVHVRVSVPRRGASTLTNTDVMVVRNPCLHPGDCLKLRTVDHPRLSHLVDCVVFASRDGDKFLVIWDPDLVPKKVAESYTYPPAKERVSVQVSREDLAKHFASYNTMALGTITSLHAKWVRSSPKGAMSDECQDLNALHSQAVDGASVKIPERLRSPPEPDSPYVIDLLQDSAKRFFETYIQSEPDALEAQTLSPEAAGEVLARFLSTEKTALSECEVVTMAAAFARRNGISLRPYLCHIDFGALATSEKHALSLQLGLTPEHDPYIWNSRFISLIRSEILRSRDLSTRDLGGPLRLQKLYSSSEQGRAAFFEYLKDATQQYNRRLMILKTDDRFSVGIFLRGPIPWDEEPEINDNVLVCPFMPIASEVSSTYWRGTKGYRLHCSDNLMQLYDQQRGNTFIFVNRPPIKSDVDIVTSIALQKISGRVQKQCGRIYRTPVVAIEIHVVSNRDRVACQAFDLRYEQVPTEEFMRRFDHKPQQFTPNSIRDLDWTDDETGGRLFAGTKQDAEDVLASMEVELLQKYFHIAIANRAEDRLFWIFETLLKMEPLPEVRITDCIDQHAFLAYSVLKKYLPDGPALLPPVAAPLGPTILRGIVRSANTLGIASLAALERLASATDSLDLTTYFDTLWWVALSVRPSTLVQELLLVLHDSRTGKTQNKTYEYAHKYLLGVAFDRAEEAADACPCDDAGRPKRQRVAPVHARLVAPKRDQEEEVAGSEDKYPTHVMAHIRVDAQTNIRIHSHIRLRLASPVDGSDLLALGTTVLDGVVLRAGKGELFLELKHPLPPEYQRVDWYLYDAGSIATSKAMMDAVLRLATEGSECCSFSDIIAGDEAVLDPATEEQTTADGLDEDLPSLNDSQKAAVRAAGSSTLALIWGPPGTGKTTVVVQILIHFIKSSPGTKILMTASTHNAVDNVLERFLVENGANGLLAQDQILRVATESSKVNKALQKFTIDARVGGSMNENPRLMQKAQQRAKEASIVFTTCSGAGLGVLRNMDFEIVLIDEASQITEPCALIPLVKGCQRAVLVGDHVQLRPTVRPMAKALEFDRSLFERLYTGPAYARMTRTMLDFYQGRLRTGTPREDEIRMTLGSSIFPWPTEQSRIFPVVFVPCAAEEDHGRSSKGNSGQVELAKYILGLLRAARGNEVAEETARVQGVSIAVLTPYSRQVQMLKQTISSSMNVVGREADIVVFSTVRSNMEGDIGFLEDERRLNVAWTRPKLGLIIVGHRHTLQANSTLWKSALAYCKEVVISPPEPN
ncbi:RdRP-domain-containing protein [Laetiporus sulphureus 93-53]|uniref:RdRP-domain-containing protein n=1 Tax=Laetiporus sulphureus 93-53 TaxID=1314785 RepID=A0A165GUG0_9APHY|nr:RdRP-domain-containing protein [Laetiporus sulphureus 93-53]KZT10828.1 RdRP-domain-containing protein [Laetiporus sulphureus 93-53]